MKNFKHWKKLSKVFQFFLPKKLAKYFFIVNFVRNPGADIISKYLRNSKIIKNFLFKYFLWNYYSFRISKRKIKKKITFLCWILDEYHLSKIFTWVKEFERTQRKEIEGCCDRLQELETTLLSYNNRFQHKSFQSMIQF